MHMHDHRIPRSKNSGGFTLIELLVVVAIIVGAAFDRPLRPGAQWDGADVTSALRLLRLIDTRRWRGQVSALVSEVRAGSWIYRCRRRSTRR